jgi:ATP/maltotriose-dependent transcriptional regulator MalT
LLVDAAARFAAVDAERARETYMEALEAAIIVGRLGGGLGMRAVAEAARGAPSSSHPPRPVDVLLDAVVKLLIEGYPTGLPALKQAMQRFRQEEPSSQHEIMRWLRLAPVAQEAAVHQLWDYEAWEEMAARAVSMARAAGALGALPVALVCLAGVRLHAGDLTGASALIEEADSITATTHYAPVSYATMVLAAWRGDDTTARDLLASTVRDAKARGEGTVLGVAGYATAVLYNGLSRYEAALAAAREGCDGDGFSFVGWTLVELIEAAARLGAREVASDALERLEERTRLTDTEWGLGLLARSVALLEGGQRADALYREAIERLGRSGLAGHLARAHLVYGEWLRRENRRADARDPLRIAHGMFERFGAEAFAGRARGELEATGETAVRRPPSTRDALTAQEARVAGLAAEGYTNAEIGSQLFISPRTAEYHLRKVFTKLGIRSRRRLRSALGDATRTVSPR